eukprot:ANDGO_08600.mRNA.1 Kinesin-like protein KIN-5B
MESHSVFVANDPVQRMLLFSPPSKPKRKAASSKSVPEEAVTEPKRDLVDSFSTADLEIEPFKVYVRVKPSAPNEKRCIDVVSDTQIRAFNSKHQPELYTYDKVYGPEVQELSIYDDAIKSSVSMMAFGKSALLFSYGISGSGKTHTITNIFPLILNDLFSMSQKNDKLLVTVSMLEVYNEKILDLSKMSIFEKSGSHSHSHSHNREVDIKDSGNGHLSIVGANEVSVGNVTEALGLIQDGIARRAQAATAMNETSSRSHAVFTIKLCCLLDNFELQEISRFAVVDLAGSERVGKTNTKGHKLVEASKINTSLMVLGRVFEKLRQVSQHKATGSNEQVVIPFRDSKLTRMFQDKMSGGAKVMMILNVTQEASEFSETTHVLRYGCTATQIDTAFMQMQVSNKALQTQENAGYKRNILADTVNSTAKKRPRNGTMTAADKENLPIKEKAGKGAKRNLQINLEEEKENVDFVTAEEVRTPSHQPTGTRLSYQGHGCPGFPQDGQGYSAEFLDEFEMEIREEVASEWAERIQELQQGMQQTFDEQLEQQEDLYQTRLKLVTETLRRINAQSLEKKSAETHQNMETLNSIFSVEMENIRSKYRQTSDELTAVKSVNVQLEKEKSKLESAKKTLIDEKVSLQGNFEHIKKALDQAEDDIQVLRSSIAENLAKSFQEQAKAQNAWIAERTDLENELCSMRQKFEDAMKQNDVENARSISLMQTRLESDMKQKESTFNTKYADLEKELESVKSQMQRGMDDLQKKLAAESKKYRALEISMEEQRSEQECYVVDLLREHDAQKRLAEMARKELESQVAGLQATVAALRSELCNERKEKEDLQKRLDQLIQVSATTAILEASGHRMSEAAKLVNTSCISKYAEEPKDKHASIESASERSSGPGGLIAALFSPLKSRAAKRKNAVEETDKMLRMGKKKRCGEYEVIVGDQMSQDTRSGKTATIFKGGIVPSVSGTGVSVQFTEMETFLIEKPSDLLSPRAPVEKHHSLPAAAASASDSASDSATVESTIPEEPACQVGPPVSAAQEEPVAKKRAGRSKPKPSAVATVEATECLENQSQLTVRKSARASARNARKALEENAKSEASDRSSSSSAELVHTDEAVTEAEEATFFASEEKPLDETQGLNRGQIMESMTADWLMDDQAPVVMGSVTSDVGEKTEGRKRPARKATKRVQSEDSPGFQDAAEEPKPAKIARSRKAASKKITDDIADSNPFEADAPKKGLKVRSATVYDPFEFEDSDHDRNGAASVDAGPKTPVITKDNAFVGEKKLLAPPSTGRKLGRPTPFAMVCAMELEDVLEKKTSRPKRATAKSRISADDEEEDAQDDDDSWSPSAKPAKRGGRKPKNALLQTAAETAGN